MSSSGQQQPDYLTSLVSYVPDYNFGYNFPTAVTAPNSLHFGSSSTQSRPISSEYLETISAQPSYNSNKCILPKPTHYSPPPPPLRSALKKAPIKVGNKPLPQAHTGGTDCTPKDIPNPETHLIKKTVQDSDKPKSLPARLTQKKKTVAFGRTVNVSQTIESTSRRNQKSSTAANTTARNKMDDQKELKVEVEKLNEKIHEMQIKIDELTIKDAERNSQILQLTEMMKKVLEVGREHEVLRTNKDAKRDDEKPKLEKYYRGKENIPPGEVYGEEIVSEEDANSPNATGQQKLHKSGKQSFGDVNDNLKWAVLKRKYIENKEFKRLVDEAIMKYGGDESLEIISSKHHKGDVDRYPLLKRGKKLTSASSPPVIRSTTRVTKQMTVEQIRQCENSPARSAAFSYDSKKYLARHGIIPALSDEDDELDNKTACNRRSEPCMHSDYKPGNSVTYYSRHDKYINPLLKHDRRYDHDAVDCGYRERGSRAGKKKSPRAILNETNYQVDHFDSDEDENGDDVIEISDDSEFENYNASAKIRTPDVRAWKGSDSPRMDRRCVRNGDTRHCMKQKLNKSAWN